MFSEDDDEDGNGFPLPGNTDKAKKCKKDELPAAFALMHGFTATNVGKNRLTVSFENPLLIFVKFTGL